MAISKRFSAIELVNPIDSPISGYGITFGGRIQLRPKDRVLIDNGGSGFRALDIYLSLFSNPVVYFCLTLLLRPNPGIRSIVPEYSKAPAMAITETNTIPTYKGVFEVFPISRGI